MKPGKIRHMPIRCETYSHTGSIMTLGVVPGWKCKECGGPIAVLGRFSKWPCDHVEPKDLRCTHSIAQNNVSCPCHGAGIVKE